MSVTAASYLAFFFSPVNPATLLSTVSADDYEAYEWVQLTPIIKHFPLSICGFACFFLMIINHPNTILLKCVKCDM